MCFHVDFCLCVFVCERNENQARDAEKASLTKLYNELRQQKKKAEAKWISEARWIVKYQLLIFLLSFSFIFHLANIPSSSTSLADTIGNDVIMGHYEAWGKLNEKIENTNVWVKVWEEKENILENTFLRS